MKLANNTTLNNHFTTIVQYNRTQADHKGLNGIIGDHVKSVNNTSLQNGLMALQFNGIAYWNADSISNHEQEINLVDIGNPFHQHKLFANTIIHYKRYQTS